LAGNVLLTRDGAIATVTLDRPDRRNSLSDDMLTDLGAAFAELRDDASTRVVIVTGAPPVFSAGPTPVASTRVSSSGISASPPSREKRFWPT
jgi:enoyl-CoA hydratase/carnithine racemase